MLTIPLELSVPARLIVTDPATGAVTEVDIEAARRALESAEASPNRWDDVRAYLTAAGLRDLADNQLVDFNNAIVAVSQALADERKKKIAGCVSLLTTSLESPATS